MSAFIMSEESLSDLAYNVFSKGQHNSDILEYFEKSNITCPEDLFIKLRWDNIRSVNERYDEHRTKKDIGEYHFSKNELTLVEMIKKIHCWSYQSCESEAVVNGKLYKAMEKFANDCCYKYTVDSDEYEEAEWN